MSLTPATHPYPLAQRLSIGLTLGLLWAAPAVSPLWGGAACAFWGKSATKIQLKTDKVTPKAAPAKTGSKLARPAIASKTKPKTGTPVKNTKKLGAKPSPATALVSVPFVIFPETPTPFTKPYLVRSIPLQVATLEPTLPERFNTADETMTTLLRSPSLLVHMETLRRSQNSLHLEQQKRLLQLLNQRYQQNVHDANRYFDYGYGQLAITRNKTGLFFLRKANDQLHNQFTSLAYAIAEADMDLEQEHATPDQYTTRKLDVSYKIQDAVKRDAKNHQPGFWPSLTRLIAPLKAMPAYSDIAQADYSEAYVPYGNRTLVFQPRHPDRFTGHALMPAPRVAVATPSAAVTTPPTVTPALRNRPVKALTPPARASVPPESRFKRYHPFFNQGRQFGLVTPEEAVLAQKVQPSTPGTMLARNGDPSSPEPIALLASAPTQIPQPLAPATSGINPVVPKPSQKHPLKGQAKGFSRLFPGEPLEISKQVDLIDNGGLQSVNFYRLNAPKGQTLFHMVVLDQGQKTLADLQTPVAPYVMEDLDKDGIFELVIRQSKVQPYDPVQVYRYHPAEEQYVLDNTVRDLFR